jgi:glycosyltransferase involved in cell wall biosynthesis
MSDARAIASERRKPNLLVLSTSLWNGGAESVIRHLAETIDRRLFNVSVGHLEERGHIGDQIVKSGVDVIGVSESPGSTSKYLRFRKLLRVIRERNIELVHTHTTGSLIDAALCKLFRPRLKVVHTFHFGNYPHVPTRLLWMERVFSRVADRLLAVGEIQRAQVKSVYSLDDAKIRTIWNGVRLPSHDADVSFRERLQAGDRIVIGTIATMIEQKGLFDLLEVARRMKDAGHKVLFVVVGEGQLRPALEAKRKELGLEDTVVFTGWVTNAASVALPSFDIFFQPSLWEAMSVVILEAMAARRPIVATRVGENPRIINNGVDGVLVDSRNVDGMVGALESLVVDADYRRRLGDAGRQKVEQAFTVEHMTRAHEQFYLDTLR